MAKISINKLGITKVKMPENKEIIYNDQIIEVKQYLPMVDKIELVSTVATLANDGINFKNTIALEMFTNLEIIKHYTNISFTDKQVEDLPKLYDLLELSGIIDVIIEAIPSSEYNYLIETIDEITTELVRYSNSARGIIDGIIGSSEDVENINGLVTNLQAELKDNENLKTVKAIVDKLG